MDGNQRFLVILNGRCKRQKPISNLFLQCSTDAATHSKTRSKQGSAIPNGRWESNQRFQRSYTPTQSIVANATISDSTAAVARNRKRDDKAFYPVTRSTDGVQRSKRPAQRSVWRSPCFRNQCCGAVQSTNPLQLQLYSYPMHQVLTFSFTCSCKATHLH